MDGHLLKLKDNLLVNLVFLLLAVLLLKGWPVPSGPEVAYLLTAFKRWHPDFLLNDWTYSQPQPEHRLFELGIGFLTLFLPLEIVGWLGRLVCWSLILIALFRIGNQFQIPFWMISLSVLFWLIFEQAPVGQEYIIGTFEAKSVAYVFLLHALNGFLEGRSLLPAMFLGLAFSFHSAVGLWGGLAIWLALLALKHPVRELVKVACMAALFALPGLIPLLSPVFGVADASAADWKYLVLVRFPYHFDLLSWPKREILSVYLFFLFNWLHARKHRESRAIRFLITYQGFLCMFFSFGVLLRLAEQYELLKFMPMRQFPVFTLLLFFFHLMNAYHYHASVRLGSVATAVAFVSLLSLKNPLGALVDQARFNYEKWTQEDTDLQKTSKWFSTHTPNGSVVIMPPWRDDCVYLSQRAQVAYWGFVPSGHLKEWRERFRALVGDEWVSAPGNTWAEQMEPSYNKLTEQGITSIVKRYGGEYLVSRASYSYPVLFDSGTYKVYSLLPVAARER